MKKILHGLFFACMALAVKSTAAPVINQNFESGFGAWSHTVSGGGGGWAITSGATNTGLGAIPAHTHYAIVNEALLGSSSYNNPATMTSPSFSLAGMTAPYLAFDQYFFQAYLPSSSKYEKAWVDFSTDGGSTYSTIDSIQYNGYPSGTFNTDWVTNFVSLSSTSATCVLRFVYEDNGGQIIGLAIDNVLVYDAASTDLALTSVSPVAGSAADYFSVGSSVTFSGVVTNYSNAAISSFNASYQVGTGSVVTNTISASVPALGSAAFSYTTSYTVPGANQYPVTFWVKATGDANAGNDTAMSGVQGVNFKPKKRILFEEGTGTWCGYCVRGIIFMDSLDQLYPDGVSIVSVHDYGSYDPMAIENTSTQKYDAFISSQIGGYPSMVIDRRYTDDPSGALTDYTNDNGIFGFANMGVTATYTGGKVKATVNLEPALNLSGDYRIELIVEEDKVTGTASGYAQHNYYGNVVVGGVPNMAHSLPLYGQGYNFNDSPTVITAGHIKFPFVARYTVPSDLTSQPNGIAGSLPSSMHAGSVYTYVDSSVAIPGDWNTANLRVVALLIDNNSSNATYGQVLNSVNTASSAWSYINDAVKNVNALASDMKVFPNPTEDIAHVQFVLSSESNVKFSVFDMMGREVFTVPAEQMNAGGQQINFSTANLPSGLYSVVVLTNNGKLTQQLSVVR